MKVRYIYSACVSISTEDCTILCDPWFGEAYDGAWAQWPRIDNPLEICGPADYVYISHVHPDHYDPAFLKAYLAKYPQAKVLIAEHKPDLLGRKLRARGIEPFIIPYGDRLLHGDTYLYPFANHANTGMNIDSALVVRHGDLSVANLNDNPFDQQQIDLINAACPGGHPTVALLPFVGAGPWPQCYEMDSDVRLMAALAKKQKYLQLFKRYCEVLRPKVAVPFAGQYWLHGEQLNLNQLRGMADATECKALWPNVWVPADGGKAVLTVGENVLGDTDPNQWIMNGLRSVPYDWPTVRNALECYDRTEIYNPTQGHLKRYEREILIPIERLPLLKLLQSAVMNAYKQFGLASKWRRDQFIHIYVKTQLSDWFHIQTNRMSVEFSEHGGKEEPRVEVFIDARYLYGMLTRLYNANSVRIGSLCRFKVVPAEYDKENDDLFGEYWDSLRV